MKKIYFISDLHLIENPKTYPHVLNFFQEIMDDPDLEHLYILGDLFCIWWGLDNEHPGISEWIAFFQKISVPISFLRGNRDFFFNKHDATVLHWTLLESGTVIEYGGHHIGLFHGDEPGLLDLRYQKIRPWIRSRGVRTLLNWVPLATRRQIFMKIREQHSQTMQKMIDIDHERWLEQCDRKPDVIVNGHLHFEEMISYKNVIRYQLGCWDHGRASVLCIDAAGNIQFISDCFNPKESAKSIVASNESYSIHTAEKVHGTSESL